MEIGGRTAFTALQQPLGAPAARLISDRPPSRSLAVNADRVSAADRARALLAGGSNGLPLPGGSAGSAPVVRSKVAAARDALMASMNADGKCYALCIADRLDLERVRHILPASAAAAGEALQAAASLESGGAAIRREELLQHPNPPWSRLRNLFAMGAARQGAAVRIPSTPGLIYGVEMANTYSAGDCSVLHLKATSKDVFVFNFGAVVFWGFGSKDKDHMDLICRQFKERCATRPLPEDHVDEDTMEFVMKADGLEDNEVDNSDPAAVAAAAIRQDQIVLTTHDPYERLAHAYALAQSVRLGVFEFIVDQSIEKTRSIPETMATHGEVVLDERELSKQIGGLLMLRCDVNLHTDILDTPDIFWDKDSFEPHYVASRTYWDIDKRVDILNQRLGVLKDLYDLLQNTLNVKHGNKLEWIIIILILVEVLLELLELVHDAWRS